MLELNNISKKFADFCLKDISLTVDQGDYFIVLGESGAGKSMLLETIAGLVRPDKGSVFMHGRDITFSGIQERKIGLVFQDHAIFPHLTVFGNIAFSLHGRKLNRHEKKARVERTAEQVSISNLLHRKPSTLSGGELQRVALARTLVQEPLILLLDEPLASLDSRIKSGIRSLLRKIHSGGQTILHVTHDYEEALSLGNKIAVIHKGSVIQQGSVQEVFTYPRSEFVAHFTGMKNFYRCSLFTENNVSFALIGENLRIRLTDAGTEKEGFILVGSEEIILSNASFISSATNNFKGVVLEIIQVARGTEVVIDAGVVFHAVITDESAKNLNLTEDKSVWMHFKATAVKFIPL